MKKAIKWLSIAGGSLVVLIVLTLLLIPMFVDMQRYMPEIEKKVSKSTERPFSLGKDLELTLFPWAGISFSDLHLGNPPGFEENDFLSVKRFEVRVKLLPLLLKDIQVKRFILKGPRIVLVKNKEGQVNWKKTEKLSGKTSHEPQEKKKTSSVEKQQEGLPINIKAIAVGEFSITEGTLLWIDHTKGERKEISDIALHLKDISLNRPVNIALSASLEEHPLSLEGKIGPVGKDPGKGTVPLDLTFKVIKQLNIAVNGKVTDPITRQQFDLALQISPFSPRKLLADLDQSFPVTTSDSKALDLISFKTRIKGTPENISLSEGTIEIDQSKITFSARAKEFSKPDVHFDFNVDHIDLDKYLPPPGDEEPAKKRGKVETPNSGKKKQDYAPLRKLVLNGAVRVGELRIKGAEIHDIYLKISGEKGIFQLDPIDMKLYQGNITTKGTFDLTGNTPRSNIKFQMKGVKAGPMIHDFSKKDFLEGTIESEVALRMSGDNIENIKKTLNGKGDILFKEGAIRGIDLAGMVRNVNAAFGLTEKDEGKPRTDFSKLFSSFTITNGLLKTPETSLSSPVLNVLASGRADLVKETLDFRVEPKFVAVLKEKKDTKQYTDITVPVMSVYCFDITVPVLVTGNFSSPRFRPDLKGILKKTLKKKILESSELKEILKGKDGEKDKSESLEKKVKGLLEGFSF